MGLKCGLCCEEKFDRMTNGEGQVLIHVYHAVRLMIVEVRGRFEGNWGRQPCP